LSTVSQLRHTERHRRAVLFLYDLGPLKSPSELPMNRSGQTYSKGSEPGRARMAYLFENDLGKDEKGGLGRVTDSSALQNGMHHIEKTRLTGRGDIREGYVGKKGALLCKGLRHHSSERDLEGGKKGTEHCRCSRTYHAASMTKSPCSIVRRLSTL